MPEMKTILITAIAGDIAQSIALIVREAYPKCRILGMDIHERHGAMLCVDRWFMAPRVTSPDYCTWLEDLILREGVDTCVPASEAELGFFAAASLREVAGARLVMPNAKAIEIGTDKLATARFLESVGCPVPWTLPVGEGGPATPMPCVFKPRHSAGSKGVQICQSLEEVRFFGHRLPDAVLQELLLPEDQEVTCAIYRTRDGRIAVLQLLRKLVGGFTGWAKVIDAPAVRAQCELLAKALDLRGSINVQLRLTPQGPRIFEINPRFSSTVLMRDKIGFRDVVWALDEALGREVNFSFPAVGTIAVRTQGAAQLAAGVQ